MVYCIVLLVLCISLASNRLSGQAREYNNMTFYKLPERAQSLKRGSISIELMHPDHETMLIGSGFLIHKGDSIYGVTNYHVIKGIPNNKELVVGFNYQKSKLYVKASVLIVNEAKDIAILNLSKNQYFQVKDTKSEQLNFSDFATIGISLISKNSEILEGIGILTIGYPLGLGKGISSNQPIVRIGIIAQAPNSDGFFYVDGVSSHGNSGSPVFNAQSNELIGMIIGFPADFIDAYDANGNQLARLPYNSSLSICISAEEIMKLVQKE